jgi:hypothetical protein
MHLDDPAFQPSRDAAARSEFAAAAAAGRRYMWHELIARSDPQALEELINWHVWAGDLERLGKEVLPIYRLKGRLAPSGEQRHRIACRAFDFGQTILCDGGLAEALGFFRLAAELSPARRFAGTARRIETVQKLYDEIRRAGGRVHRTAGACTFAAALWGEERIADYLNYAVRSMLAPGNLPGLRDHDLHFSMLTTLAGRRQIEAHPVHASLTRCGQVHWFIFSEALTDFGPGEDLSELLDHLSIALCQEFGSHVFLLPTDGIIARDSLVNLLRYLEIGHYAAGAGMLSATREQFTPRLEAAFGSEPVLSVSARELAELALRCLHEESSAKLVIPENQNFVRSPRELIWPMADGMYSRCFYARPLVISAAALERGFDMRWPSLELTLRCGLFLSEDDYRFFKLIPSSEEAYIGRLLPRRRAVERCGRAFDPRMIADEARCAGGFNRWLLTQPQFIPCEPPFATDRDPEADIAEILCLLEDRARP